MTESAMVCANHPSRETTLRCNRCEKPICAQCAVQTPVGYRCRECVRGQQKIFETSRSIDLLVAFVISAVGVGLAAAVLSYLWYWGLFVAPVVGGGIAEGVRWAVRRRRSLRLPWAAAAGGVLGAVVYLFLTYFPTLRWMLAVSGSVDLAGLGATATSVIWPLIHGGLMVSALFYRLRGIRL